MRKKMKQELEGMWAEVIVGCFKILFLCNGDENSTNKFLA
jgi:hypothetical protein